MKVKAMSIPPETNIWTYCQPILIKALFVGIVAQMLALMFNKHDSDKGVGCGWTVLAFCVWGIVLVGYSVIVSIESDRPDLLAHNPRLSTALYVIALTIGNVAVWLGSLLALFTKPPPIYSGSSDSMADKKGIFDADGKLIGYVDRD